MQVQLLHYATPMGLDGVDTQLQRGGDFFVRLALGDPPQDFALAGAHQIERTGDVFAVIAEHGIGDTGAEKVFAPGDGAYGQQQVPFAGVFAQIAFGAGAQDFTDLDGVLVHGEGQDARARGGGSLQCR